MNYEFLILIAVAIFIGVIPCIVSCNKNVKKRLTGMKQAFDPLISRVAVTH